MVRELKRKHPDVPAEDMLCTLTHLTAESMAAALDKYVFPQTGKCVVALCGGGAKNRFMVGLIKKRLRGREVTDTGALGVDPDAREALAFAVLANEALCGVPAGLPRVTGAGRPRILGKISLV